MRVLHVYKDYFPVLGGIENHLRTLVQELSREPDIEPAVLVTSPNRRTERWLDGNVPVTFAGRWATTASTPLSTALVTELARDPATIIHLHFPYPVGEAAYLFGGRNRPLVITYHSDVVRQRQILRFYRPVLEEILRRADRIIATSPAYARSSPFLSRFPGKTEIVPLGVDLRTFHPPVTEAERAPDPTVLFVGRFRYYKGLDYLIEAIAGLPDARLILCGGGPEENRLRALVTERGLGSRVQFTGEVTEAELTRCYQRAWVFVLPAIERSEAFGQVLIEAMACRLPLITTELGTGTTYVNLAGQTGLVVPPRDSHALQAAIRQLLDDRTMRQRLGESGRVRVESQFGQATMVERTLAIYRFLGV